MSRPSDPVYLIILIIPFKLQNPFNLYYSLLPLTSRKYTSCPLWRSFD